MSKISTDRANLIEELYTMTKAKAFLFSEFMHWLYKLCTSENGELSLKLGTMKRAKPIKLWIDDYMVLESARGDCHTQILKGGAPANSLEAKTSAKTGKSPKSLKLGLSIEGIGEFSGVITNPSSEEGLSVKSVKFPSSESNDEEERLDEQLDRSRMFADLIDTLFQNFLSQRDNKTLAKLA